MISPRFKSQARSALPKIREGSFIWSSPPAVADTTVEELRKSRHKRQHSYHLFIFPKIMKHMWIGPVYKLSDLVLEIKVQYMYWTADCHEILIIAIHFPFISSRSWQLRNSPALLDVGRLLFCVNFSSSRNQWKACRKVWCGKC